MITAKRASVWSARYEVAVDGRPVGSWRGSSWRSGGEFQLDGRRYRVSGNTWGNRFTMVDGDGAVIAAADRVGRKRWTVEAGGETYEFRRASLWTGEQELHVGGRRMGSVRRPSGWRTDLTAELPGLPLPVQLFVVGVVMAMQADASGAAVAAAA
jgi:hypothetical protein